jgi:hypothetical protein
MHDGWKKADVCGRVSSLNLATLTSIQLKSTLMWKLTWYPAQRTISCRRQLSIVAPLTLMPQIVLPAVAMMAKQLAILQVIGREADGIAQPCMCRLVVKSSQPNHGSFDRLRRP